jgi:hypothetical protein
LVRKVGSQSIHAAGDWNRDWPSVCAEIRRAPHRGRAVVRNVVYGYGKLSDGARAMSFADTRSDGTVEECLDELNDLMAGLQRYSPTVLAMAMRVHLGTLLQALLEAQLCTREELRDFVRELERDALQYDED